METKALELAPVKPQELTRLATDVAGLCRDTETSWLVKF